MDDAELGANPEALGGEVEMASRVSIKERQRYMDDTVSDILRNRQDKETNIGP